MDAEDATSSAASVAQAQRVAQARQRVIQSATAYRTTQQKATEADSAATQQIERLNRSLDEENRRLTVNGRSLKLSVAQVQQLRKEKENLEAASRRVAQSLNQEQAAHSGMSRAARDVAQAERAVQAALADVDVNFRKVNEAVKAHGAHSNEASTALSNLRATQERFAAATELAERASLKAANVEDRLGAIRARVARDTNVVRDATTRLRRGFDDAAGSATLLGRFLTRLAGSSQTAGGAFSTLGRALSFIKFPLIIFAVQQLISVISALGAELFLLASAVGPAFGALLALPTIAAAAGAAMGTLMLGFGGVGKALKAYTQGQDAAGKAAMRSAGAAGTAANQQIQNAEQLAAAQHSITEAQYSAKQAQEALTRARKEARDNIDQLRQSIVDAALAERGASLSLEEARANLIRVMNDPGSTALERQQAQLAVDEASNNLKKTQKESQQVRKDYQDAAKKGVEGADNVKAAKKAEADANYAVAQAVQNLADIQRQQAQQAAAGGAAGADAMDNYKQALADLPPAAQAFVKQLISMKAQAKQLKATAASNMLPGFTSALKSIQTMFPTVNAGIAVTAKALGDVAASGARMMSTNAAQKQLGQLLKGNAPIIKIFGDAFFRLGGAMVSLGVAAQPFTKWIAEVVDKWAKYLQATTAVNTQNGRISNWLMTRAKPALQTLGSILHNIGSLFWSMGKAGRGASDDLLGSIDRITGKWAEWAKGFEGQNKLKAYFGQARDTVREMNGLIGALLGYIGSLAARVDTAGLFRQIREQIVPAFKALVNAFTSGTAGKDFITFLANLMQLTAKLAQTSTGPVTIFIGVVMKLSGALLDLVRVPGIGDFLATLITAFAALRAVQLVGAVSGINGMARAILAFKRGSAEGMKNAGGLTKAFAKLGNSKWGKAFKEQALSAINGLKGMNASSLKALGVLGLVAAATLAVGKAISNWTERNKIGMKTLEGMKGRIENWTDALRESNGVITESIRLDVAKQLQDSGLADKAAKAGISLGQLTDGVTGGKEAFKKLIEQWKASGKPADDTILAALAMAGGFDLAQTNAKKLNGAVGDVTETVKTAAEKIEDLAGQVDDYTTQTVNAYLATLDWQDALAGVKTLAEQNGTALSGNTQAARDNQRAFADMAQKGIAEAMAQYRAGKITQEQLDARLQKNYEALLKAAGGAKFNTGELVKMLTQMGLTPEQIETKVKVTGVDGVMTTLAEYKRQVDAITEDRTVRIKVGTQGGVWQATIRGEGQATGGIIHGPGTGTSDTAGMFALSDGEAVIPAKAVSQYPGLIQHLINAGRGLARGGVVQAPFIQQSKANGAQGSLLQQLNYAWSSFKLPDFIIKFAAKMVEPPATPPGPGNAATLATLQKWASQAVNIAKFPISWVAAIVRRAMFESGGNPNAINLWDENAKAGHPSKGLMQTIDSTFLAYMLPGHANIWNPVDNIIAAIRYIAARYGSIFSIDPPVQGYAGGGRVGGSGDRDTVPAMLTPGEFVIRKQAAQAIGLDNLMFLNAAKFHGGGPVRGIGPGNTNYAMAALKFQEGKGVDNYAWTTALASALAHAFPRAFAKIGAKWPASIAAWINKYRPRTYDQVSRGMRLPYWYPEAAYQQNYKAFTGYSGKFMKGIDLREQAWVKDYQYRLGVAKTGRWNSGMYGASDHILNHALGRAHGWDLPHPWSGPVTAAEKAIADTVRSNTLQTEWNSLLTTIASWGLTDLLDWLQQKGIADGMEVARSAVKDKAAATALNDTIKKNNQLTGNPVVGGVQFDQATLLKAVSVVAGGSAANPVGIRGLATALKVPDYVVVNMFDALIQQIGSTVPEALLAKLKNDVTLFRQGLFYAAGGGAVPGAGNSDSVPAMLTPGEFVLRRGAAEALGSDNLARLNKFDALKGFSFFAAGGPVVGSAAQVMRSGARVGAGGVTPNVTFDTKIYNPVVESSTYSMNKLLQTKAITGQFDRVPQSVKAATQ